MGLRNNPPTIRRRVGSSAASPSESVVPLRNALAEANRERLQEFQVSVQPVHADDTLDRVMAELSHDLRQPLTSLRMNLQSAVKLLQQPTPSVSAALDALSDCLGTEHDMIELISRVKQRASATTEVAAVTLNELASDLVVTARGFHPNWHFRVEECYAPHSPLVTGGLARLRLALLSILRRALIIGDSEPATPDTIVVETQLVVDYAELRFTGLPLSLSASPGFQGLHTLITTLVEYLRGHVNLSLHEEHLTLAIIIPAAPTRTLHLAEGSHGD
ncbi:MAG TPA: hypothetical protein VGH98_25010 [Gemmatimonadaceae bacterium]|jgi:signal transduction histidine kinase